MLRVHVLLFLFALLLVAATATAQADFSWDAGCASLGYRSPDRMLMELEVVPLTLMGTSIPLYLKFSPLQVAGSPNTQSEQFQLDMESLTLLNLTAGYAFVFGRLLMLAPQFQLNYLDPTDLTHFHLKPQLQLSLVYNMTELNQVAQLQQRLISLSVGMEFSNRDAFTPHFQVTVGVNIFTLANLFSQLERKHPQYPDEKKAGQEKTTNTCKENPTGESSPNYDYVPQFSTLKK